MQSTRPFLFVLIASLKCEHREGENPPIYSGAGRLKQRVESRKIRLIEGNAKFCHLKKLTCKGTLLEVFICLRPRTPAHSIRVYGIIIHTGKGEGRGRVEPERRFTKAGPKIPKLQYLQSLNCDKSCRKVPLQVNFLR
jgi:hypothetical protein